MAGDITDLINRSRAGDREAGEAAFASIYDELKRIALGALAGSRRETLSATALVNEACLKLLPARGEISDRRHFFRLAAKAMRQILVDHARRRVADKRGGDWIRTEITEHLGESPERGHDLIAIDQAMHVLHARDPQLVTIVESYFFAGLTFEEIAAELGTSDRSVRRDWETARVLLLRALRDPGASPAP